MTKIYDPAESTTNDDEGIHIDDSQCPLCQQRNLCMNIIDPNSECWCKSASITSAQLDTIPKDLKGKSCICQKCITSFNGNP